MTDDSFFNSDVELVEFIKKYHESDELKYLSSDDIEFAKEKEKNVIIEGFQKSRMIALFPDGNWKISGHLCSCYCCNKDCLMNVLVS